jgi:L-ascorbate metabolism protein UlaG (beta-lactamase superfamily)
MLLRHLGWSGLELRAQGASLVIDTTTGAHPFQRDFLEDARSPVPPAHGPALAALVTHLHFDHTDVPAIEAAVGPEGTLLRPPPFEGTAEEGWLTATEERDLAASRLDVRVPALWEPATYGPFTVTAVPAIDGFGDPQVSWVVEADGARVLHGGDTLFHGLWWLIAARLGPVDVAALPVNGAVVTPPPLQPPSLLPRCLGPREAATAAAILGARLVVPMHFGMHIPGDYVEVPDPVGVLREHVDGREVAELAPGEELDLG